MRDSERELRRRAAIQITLAMMAGAMITLGGAALIWLCSQVDWRAAQDFFAPTAAQARTTGWVALSEAATEQEMRK